MDAELLGKLQESGARIRVGDQVGLIAGFRTGREGLIFLQTEPGQVVQIPTDTFEQVDPLDDVKVAAAQAHRDQEALGFQIASRLTRTMPLVP